MVIVVIRGYLGWWSNVQIKVYTDSGSARARVSMRHTYTLPYFLKHALSLHN